MMFDLMSYEAPGKRQQSSGKCTERSMSGKTSAAWPMMRIPKKIGKGTEGGTTEKNRGY
jgi:hypothetical protein